MAHHVTAMLPKYTVDGEYGFQKAQIFFFSLSVLYLYKKKTLSRNAFIQELFSPISSKQQPPTERISAHTRTASGNIFVVSYGSEKNDVTVYMRGTVV